MFQVTARGSSLARQTDEAAGPGGPRGPGGPANTDEVDGLVVKSCFIFHISVNLKGESCSSGSERAKQNNPRGPSRGSEEDKHGSAPSQQAPRPHLLLLLFVPSRLLRVV